MSLHPDQERERLIEEYLDGRLPEAARHAFEQRLEREAGLRAEVQMQRELDSALGRCYAPPALDDIVSRAAATLPVMPARRARVPFGQRPLAVRLLVEVAVAAAVGLVIGGGYVLYRGVEDPGGVAPALARQTLEQFYQERAAKDFAPDWVCPPEVFRVTFAYRLGQPVLMTETPRVRMLGLAYSNTLTPFTVNVMAKVDGQGVIVYADKADAAPPQRRCDGSGLRLFERRLGPLILYELTPLDEPHVLDLLYIPQASTSEPASAAAP